LSKLDELKVSKMRLGIWDLDNIFVNSPCDCICCLITAEKGTFSLTKKLTQWNDTLFQLQYGCGILQTSLLMSICQTQMKLTQWGLANKHYQFQH